MYFMANDSISLPKKVIFFTNIHQIHVMTFQAVRNSYMTCPTRLEDVIA